MQCAHYLLDEKADPICEQFWQCAHVLETVADSAQAAQEALGSILDNMSTDALAALNDNHPAHGACSSLPVLKRLNVLPHSCHAAACRRANFAHCRHGARTLEVSIDVLDCTTESALGYLHAALEQCPTVQYIIVDIQRASTNQADGQGRDGDQAGTAQSATAVLEFMNSLKLPMDLHLPGMYSMRRRRCDANAMQHVPGILRAAAANLRAVHIDCDISGADAAEVANALANARALEMLTLLGDSDFCPLAARDIIEQCCHLPALVSLDLADCDWEYAESMPSGNLDEDAKLASVRAAVVSSFEGVAQLTQLRTLVLPTSCNVACTALTEQIGALTNLQELTAGGTWLLPCDPCWQQLVVQLPRLPQLQSLSFAGLAAVLTKRAGVQLLAASLVKLPALTHLQDVRFWGWAVPALADHIEAFTALRELQADDTFCNVAHDVCALSQRIGVLKQLRSLDLRFSLHQNAQEALTGLADSISALQGLTELQIHVKPPHSTDQAHNATCRALAHALAQTCSCLRAFACPGCPAGGTAASTLCDALKKHHPRLQVLAIPCSNVDDAAAAAMATGLPELTALQYLNLYGNKMSPRGLCVLVPCLARMRSLVRVRLGGSRVDDASIAAMSGPEQLELVVLALHNLFMVVSPGIVPSAPLSVGNAAQHSMVDRALHAWTQLRSLMPSCTWLQCNGVFARSMGHDVMQGCEHVFDW